MSVVVVATIVPLADHRDEVIAAFTEAIEQVHGEDGCELYALHEAPDRLIMIEKWASRDALRVHSTAPALAAMGPKLAGKVAVARDTPKRPIGNCISRKAQNSHDRPPLISDAKLPFTSTFTWTAAPATTLGHISRHS